MPSQQFQDRWEDLEFLDWPFVSQRSKMGVLLWRNPRRWEVEAGGEWCGGRKSEWERSLQFLARASWWGKRAGAGCLLNVGVQSEASVSGVAPFFCRMWGQAVLLPSPTLSLFLTPAKYAEYLQLSSVVTSGLNHMARSTLVGWSRSGSDGCRSVEC